MAPLFRSTVSPEVEAARAKYPWMIAAYLSFGLALLVILSIAAWGASVDFEEARASLLRAEVNRLRSHAVRSVIRLQDLMSFEEKNEGKVIGLDSPEVNRFLNEQWQRHIPEDPSRSSITIHRVHIPSSTKSMAGNSSFCFRLKIRPISILAKDHRSAFPA